jgi:hypothetical protein
MLRISRSKNEILENMSKDQRLHGQECQEIIDHFVKMIDDLMQKVRKCKDKSAIHEPVPGQKFHLSDAHCLIYFIIYHLVVVGEYQIIY